MLKILVVGKLEPELLFKLLEVSEFKVETVSGFKNGVERLKENRYDVVITDFPGEQPPGDTLVDYTRENHSEIKCVVVAENPVIEDSVAALTRGASDFLAMPVDPDRLILSIKKNAGAAENHKKAAGGRGQKRTSFDFSGIVGESREIRRISELVKKVSKTDSTILITGESGTGKELVARAIHRNSERRNAPMVVINCGAIPGELLESELFGHEKGAFTGAHKARAGRFELADGGTIFLDEIGDMSPDLQVKLLRVLQEKCFERVGSTKSTKVDIRILSATNKDLKHAVDEGKFREDLYYRLNVIPVKMPPLRERKTDIPLLAAHFMERLNIRNGMELKEFSAEAMEKMAAYDWPGNVRELENLVERVAVLVESGIVKVVDLPDRIRGIEPEDIPEQPLFFGGGLDFGEAVERHQKALILRALNETNWVKAKAAALLNMKRTTLVEKIKKMNIERGGTMADELLVTHP